MGRYGAATGSCRSQATRLLPAKACPFLVDRAMLLKLELNGLAVLDRSAAGHAGDRAPMPMRDGRPRREDRGECAVWFPVHGWLLGQRVPCCGERRGWSGRRLCRAHARYCWMRVVRKPASP